MDELESLINPICKQYPNLENEDLIGFLHGPDQARAYAIHRELMEILSVPLVTRDRQRWHEAVENEILYQLPRGSTTVNKIVAAVLSRNPAYPLDPVYRYAEYVLEGGSIFGDDLETGD
jgi:hypothetical protein